jgi:hypothetical protein
LDALGDRPTVFGFERDGLEDQEIESALDKIGWLCHMPRLPTIIDDHGEVVAQASLMSDQPTGTTEETGQVADELVAAQDSPIIGHLNLKERTTRLLKSGNLKLRKWANRGG